MATKIAVGMNAQFLKTDVSGYVAKDDKTLEILICPTNMQTSKVCTLGEILEDITKQFGIEEEEMKGKINTACSIFGLTVDSLKFSLHQIFFYRKSVKAETEGGKDTVITEFAFSVEIASDTPIGLAGILTISSFYLCVWNTNRKQVLDTLKMDELINLLPN